MTESELIINQYYFVEGRSYPLRLIKIQRFPENANVYWFLDEKENREYGVLLERIKSKDKGITESELIIGDWYFVERCAEKQAAQYVGDNHENFWFERKDGSSFCIIKSGLDCITPEKPKMSELKFEVNKKYEIGGRILKAIEVYDTWIKFSDAKTGCVSIIELDILKNLNIKEHKELLKKTVVKYILFDASCRPGTAALDELLELDVRHEIYNSVNKAKNSKVDGFTGIAKVTIQVEEVESDD